MQGFFLSVFIFHHSRDKSYQSIRQRQHKQHRDHVEEGMEHCQLNLRRIGEQEAEQSAETGRLTADGDEQPLDGQWQLPHRCRPEVSELRK